MGLFDFFRKKKTSEKTLLNQAENLADKITKQFFPNGGLTERTQLTNGLCAALGNKYSFEYVLNNYIFVLSGFFFQQGQSIENAIEDLLKRKDSKLNREEATIICNYAVEHNEQLSKTVGLMKMFEEAYCTEKTIDGMIPNGIGEFGCKTNPIPTHGIFESQVYLKHLYFSDKSKIKFERIGSFESPITRTMVDNYMIYDNMGKMKCSLFISPYYDKTSTKVPVGFIYIKDDGTIVEATQSIRNDKRSPAFLNNLSEEGKTTLKRLLEVWNRKDYTILCDILNDDFCSGLCEHCSNKESYIDMWRREINAIKALGVVVSADLGETKKHPSIVLSYKDKIEYYIVLLKNNKIARIDQVNEVFIKNELLYDIAISKIAKEKDTNKTSSATKPIKESDKSNEKKSDDRELSSLKEGRMILIGNNSFFYDRILKGTKYVEQLNDSVFIHNKHAEMMGWKSGAYKPQSIKTCVEEFNQLFISPLFEEDKKTYNLIFDVYLSAYKEGMTECCNNLGILAKNAENDFEKALHYFTEGANVGSLNAMNNKFSLLWQQHDYESAINHLLEVEKSEKPSLVCLWNLATLYYIGNDIKGNTLNDKEKAIDILNRIKNMDSAMYRLDDYQSSIFDKVDIVLQQISSGIPIVYPDLDWLDDCDF